MRILCLADIHSDFAAYDPASSPDADICLIAGDITEYGHSHPRVRGMEMREALAWLAALGERFPTFVIPGNHDIGVRNSDFSGICGVTPILDLSIEHAGLALHGVSLSPTYDFPRMARMFDFMTVDPREEEEAFSFEPVDIVVSHCPPHGVLDRLRAKDFIGPPGASRNIGSNELLRYIERNRPKLVVCGHVHNENGEKMVCGTRVVNAAKAWRVVELDVGKVRNAVRE